MRLITGFLLVLLTCGSHETSRADDDLHISLVPEFYYLHRYPAEKGHKALAVGPGGTWSSYTDQSSAKLAQQRSMRSCEDTLRRWGGPELAKEKCVVFDVDGKSTSKAPPIGIPFGTVLSGPDLPMIKGKSWAAARGKARGTLLMVHGCDGVWYPSGWRYAWTAYYQAIGFRVLVPNSFADRRPPSLCGLSDLTKINQQTEIIKLRIAQTRRTIAEIRREFPGEPLYLHGHSEGGLVVQGLGEKVDGIIATGITCGFLDSGASNMPAGVPTLVFAGSRDLLVPEAKTQKKFAASCKRANGGKLLRGVVIPGMRHLVAPWWPSVMPEIAKFLKAKPISIVRRKGTNVSIPPEVESQLKPYRTAKKHKALAGIDEKLWTWEHWYDSPLDAEEAALFNCDEQQNYNSYAADGHAHACWLWDSDDKPPKK